jgi:hypothetical protein
MRCERGYTEQLPDLAVWLKRSSPPVALIAESGGRREDRQKMILEGWRDAVQSGRYAAVRYDCASTSVANWISRVARKVWLTAPALHVAVQTSAEEIAALSSAGRDIDAPVENQKPSGEVVGAHDELAQPQPPKPVQARPPEPPPVPEPETAEAAAERERVYREIFGLAEPKPRRRWRR